MSGYFGEPYARSFTLPLPLSECLARLEELDGRHIHRDFAPNEFSDFDIVMEIEHVSEHFVEFNCYATYEKHSVYSRRTTTRIYGNVTLHGQCKWQNYETTISYDFSHPKGVPAQYLPFSGFIFSSRKSVFGKRADKYIRIVIGLVFGFFFILGIVSSENPAAAICPVSFWLAWVYFVTRLFPGKQISTNPVKLLDSLMQDTFIHNDRRKKDIGHA